MKEPGLGEQGAAKPGVRAASGSAFCALGYKPGRNVASEGVSSVDGRQEEHSVPSVSIYLSELGLSLPPPLWLFINYSPGSALQMVKIKPSA